MSKLYLKEVPLRSATVMANKSIHEKSVSHSILEELSYNQNFESQTTDKRSKNKLNINNNIGNAQLTSSSGVSQGNYKS